VQELKSGVVPLLIPTPNATNEIGYNRDRFLLNPSLSSEEHLRMFRFLGILLGVAVRTKKPLDLYLAPPVWKQLAGMALTSDDLEEVCSVLIMTMMCALEFAFQATSLTIMFPVNRIHLLFLLDTLYCSVRSVA